MTGWINNTRLAAGMIETALRRMAAEYPFHASLLSGWKIQAAEFIETAGVTIRDGRIHLFYSPDFVVECSYTQLIGVLHHEVNHVILGHMLADPADYPNWEARIIAEEVTANEWVKEELPGAPILLEHFPELAPNESTAERYRRLDKKLVIMSRKKGESTQKIVPREAKIEPDGEKNRPELQPLDDHGLWEEARKNSLGELAVRVAVKGAVERLSPDERNKLPALLRRQIGRILRGISAGSTGEAVLWNEASSGGIDWRTVLRRYVSRLTGRRPVFNRLPRPFPELAGVLPGHAHQAEKTMVLAVIDTSGSIDAAMLAQISLEIEGMSREHKVTVVECDSEIQKYYPYASPIRHVKGRGGTDLRPPLAASFLARFRPNVVVYFTDGYGPAPSEAPAVPVIWCITPDGKRPASWGKEVRMSVC